MLSVDLLRDGNITKSSLYVARDTCREVTSLAESSLNPETRTAVSQNSHEKAMAEKDAIEAAIRHAADPGGLYSRNLIDTAGLVKNIRKRHRDALEENKREKNAMRIERENLQHKFDDEKDRLYRIIRGQNEAVQFRYEQDQQIREDFEELQNKYSNLRADNEAKDDRIAELEDQLDIAEEKCETATNDSVEALAQAARRTEYRITCIDEKHGEEMDVLRRKNNALQDRVKAAENKRPVHIFHKAQVGTVCGLLEKLRQVKEVKKEEVLAKDAEIKELGTKVGQYELEIDVLKAVADTDSEVLQRNDNLLRETQTSLRNSEDKIRRYQGEVRRLKHRIKVWESDCSANLKEACDLKMELFTLRVAQRTELIEVKAKNEGLQASNDWLRAANERLDQDLESWENGSVSRVRAYESKNKDALPGTVERSLANALKAANTKADGLQMMANSLHAEKEVLQKQLQSPSYTYDPQIQEQVERLRVENELLRKAAADAPTLKADLIAQFAVEVQQLEQQFANKTLELELGFNQGFENLCALRDQWLSQKRRSEEDHYRAIVAADIQHKLERQGQEDHFKAICKEKEDDLQREDYNLRSRESGLALKVSNFDASDEKFVEMKSRAEKAEEEGRQLRIAKTNLENHESLTVRNLSDQLLSLRRDGERHMDLLNEEIGKMDVLSRESELHSELQRANCSINYFSFQVGNHETSSEVLSQGLYGADFDESDVRHLKIQERPVLLAQLQAAKRTLEGLRSSLVEGPNVNVDKANSILLAPRGDEDAAKPAEDIFGPSNEYSPPPTHQPPTRKRAGVPLGAPTSGEYDDNTAYDDWGDQTVDAGAKISTHEEILSRRRSQPKSRLNREPAISLPPRESIAAIREQ